MAILTAVHGSGSQDEVTLREVEPNESFSSYCYMFKTQAEAEALAVPFGGTESFYFGCLDDLRLAMEEFGNHGDMLSNIPAAYTYFGQFLNHDISAPVRMASAAGPGPHFIEADPDLLVLTTHRRTGGPAAQLAKLRNEHAQPMTLNSLYGGGPFDGASTSLYEPGTARFVLAKAYDDPNMQAEERQKLNLAGKSLCDLPRDGARKIALIADRRNDQNLVISQLHLAFMLFHNRVVDYLSGIAPGRDAKSLFDEARRIVTLHYQWCALNDYLDRSDTANHSPFRGIVPGAMKSFKGMLKQPDMVPLEFTTAAFRFGHAMVSAQYDYNEVFSKSGVRPADLLQLFLFTSRKAMNNQAVPEGVTPQVPLHWIIDWNMFLDDPPAGTAAELINPRLAGTMFDLQENLVDSKMRDGFESICLRNLRRGYHRFIPSGQVLAKQLRIPELTAAELLSGFGDFKMQQSGTTEKLTALLMEDQFGGAMPAWVYFLCEAKLTRGGSALGPVAGTIVAETIVGLLKHNLSSVLNTRGKTGTWNPQDDGGIRTGKGQPVNSLRRILEFAQAVECKS